MRRPARPVPPLRHSPAEGRALNEVLSAVTYKSRHIVNCISSNYLDEIK